MYHETAFGTTPCEGPTVEWIPSTPEQAAHTGTDGHFIIRHERSPRLVGVLAREVKHPAGLLGTVLRLLQIDWIRGHHIAAFVVEVRRVYGHECRVPAIGFTEQKEDLSWARAGE